MKTPIIIRHYKKGNISVRKVLFGFSNDSLEKHILDELIEISSIIANVFIIPEIGEEYSFYSFRNSFSEIIKLIENIEKSAEKWEKKTNQENLKRHLEKSGISLSKISLSLENLSKN